MLEPMYKSLKSYWEQCPEDILSSYGPDYLEEFKVSLTDMLSCSCQMSSRADPVPLSFAEK